jgi:ubiquinone/menaquinone biosynthesis C-methylase UbiE
MSHFDEKARAWDINPVFRDRANQIAAAIAAEVPLHTGMTVLDYGCGTGLLSFPLRDRLGTMTLADSSAGMLEVLAEKIAADGDAQMHACRLDLMTDPVPAQRYDLIYTSMTLHHVPDTAHILRTFHDLLQPGGYLCIADLDQEDGSFHGIEYDLHHGFDRTTLGALAHAAGFAETRFRTVFEIVKERTEGPRAYPVFLMTARRK